MRKPVSMVSDHGLYSHRKRLGAWNFGFKKKRGSPICIAKTKGLISCAVTAQLIRAFFLHRQNSIFLMMQLNLF